MASSRLLSGVAAAGRCGVAPPAVWAAGQGLVGAAGGAGLGGLRSSASSSSSSAASATRGPLRAAATPGPAPLGAFARPAPGGRLALGPAAAHAAAAVARRGFAASPVAAVARRRFCAAPADDGSAEDPEEAQPTFKASLAEPIQAAKKSDQDNRVYRPMDETVRTFLNPAHFFALLRSHGTSFFVGVPDSLLKDICAYFSDNLPKANHIISANEGTALATAAGHYLATRNIPCVYLQNSGLGNTVNPLLSLCSAKVYSIPVLLLVGWRGEPGKKDEPQHLLQGKLTPSMLREMNVPYEILPDYAEGAFEVLETAYAYMRKEQAPFALLVKKQTFEKYKLSGDQGAFCGSDMLHREEILEHIIDMFPRDPLVTTTGFTSREIFELRASKGQSHEQDFLTVGSMGHCSSIALGIAASKPSAQVLCIDGDGAAIMHMGSMVTLGKSALPNFKHVLINNAVHDSVGGQPTGASNVDFPMIARACGYRAAERARTADEIVTALRRLRDEEGPYFLEVQALPGARVDLGRPTTTTYQNKEDFMKMLDRL